MLRSVRSPRPIMGERTRSTWWHGSLYHADGSQYGGSVSAPALAVREQALSALKGLGFQEKQAKLAMAQICVQAGGQPSLDEVIRQALALLT